MGAAHAAIDITIDGLHIPIVQPAKRGWVFQRSSHQSGDVVLYHCLHFSICFKYYHAVPFSHEIQNVNAFHLYNGEKAKKGQDSTALVQKEGEKLAGYKDTAEKIKAQLK